MHDLPTLVAAVYEADGLHQRERRHLRVRQRLHPLRHRLRDQRAVHRPPAHCGTLAAEADGFVQRGDSSRRGARRAAALQGSLEPIYLPLEGTSNAPIPRGMLINKLEFGPPLSSSICNTFSALFADRALLGNRFFYAFRTAWPAGFYCLLTIIV